MYFPIIKDLFLVTSKRRMDTYRRFDFFVFFLLRGACKTDRCFLTGKSRLLTSSSSMISIAASWKWISNCMQSLFTLMLIIWHNIIIYMMQIDLCHYYYYFDVHGYWKKGYIKGCPKAIDLKIIFRNILWENDNTINFVDSFYIFHRSNIKSFLMLFIDNYHNGTR